ncbi:MAG TPA: site-specific integrase [Xanthobacteraceae bacterium]|nr:site-specific integrase [Xanthobacteraceae bacterium]
MGLIPNEHGVWIVRRKVPKRLQEAVARVLNNDKDRQTFLQKTTGTKSKKEATRLAPAILVEFGKILAEAETLLEERALRTALGSSEIDRIADYHYASVLAADDDFTTEGAVDDEDLVRSVGRQLMGAGVEYDMPTPLDTERPPYGLTNRQVTKRHAELSWYLPIMREALARGDIGKISEMITELLDRFHLNLDPSGASYRKLGMAVLRADVRAHEALARRYRGEPVETPPITHLEPTTEPHLSVEGRTLRDAFSGWKKERDRSSGTLAEYERAIDLFIQLHGNMPVATITRDHARTFREALQDVPRSRPGELAKATLPEFLEWRRSHPEAKGLTPETVNKLLGGVQAIVKWGGKSGLIPDDVRWADPFAEMRLPKSDDPEGGPFAPDELRTLFASPVFAKGEIPEAGQGAVAFWLPMLALFTGARRNELASLQVADVGEDEATEHWTLSIHTDRQAGKTLKTTGSARTIPLHPELIRLGFLTLVEAARKRGGNDAWLIPAVAPKGGNIKAWTKWFRRYLDRLGITDERKGLHSLRHNFKDALRAAGVQEDLNDALTGHSVNTVGRSYGARARHPKQRHRTIIDRFGMAQLIAAIDKVNYHSIDLQAVHWRKID